MKKMQMIFFVVLVVVLQALFAVTINAEQHECVPPVNGRIYLVMNSLEKYLVECNAKYTLQGSRIMFCVNGFWYGQPPICVENNDGPTCENLPAPFYGTKRCDGVSIGNTCRFRCRDGYILKGSSDRYCQRSLTWSGTQPVCLSECPVPPPLINGTVLSCSEKPKFGDTCSFRCNSGFVLEGPQYMFCKQNGKILDEQGSERYPRCIAIFPHVSSGVRMDIRYQQKNEFQERSYVNPRRNSSATHSCGPSNGGCSQHCILLNKIPQCLCSNGYKLVPDGRTCEDIDECQIEPHLCDHLCRNTEGSYECYCHLGYVLNGNKCEASQLPESRATDDQTYVDKRSNTTSNRVFTLSALATRRPAPRARDDPQDNFQETRHRQSQDPTFGDNPCLINNGGCHHICNPESGLAKCECKTGYRLHGGYCLDINECEDKSLNNCPYKCQNTLGSFKCSCPLGYTITSDAKCIDIDECLAESLNRCHHKCHNTLGSYTCSCLPGYVLTSDGKCEGCRSNSFKSEDNGPCTECPPNSYTETDGKNSIADCICYPGFLGSPEKNIACEDIDECAIDNFNCSDKCVNTPGGAHCSCPRGFEVKDDGKTCGDIDECNIKNGGCEGICSNTVGNFTCSCSEGYVASKKDRYSCDDINECAENNGGCSQKCINFLGGYYCACHNGYRLDFTQKNCFPIKCPRLPVPHHSRLRCKSKSAGKQNKILLLPESEEYSVGISCKVVCNSGFKAAPQDKAIECMENGTWDGVLPECKALQCSPLAAPENGDVHPRSCTTGRISIKGKCTFTCRPGYRLQGKAVNTCKNNRTWSVQELPECVPVDVLPSISCPDDIIVELKPEKNSINVTIPKPKTNMNEVEIRPDWVKVEEAILFPAGTTDITFTAINPTFNNSTQMCIMSVIVLDKEPPVIYGCPDFIEVRNASVYGTPVTWQEPEIFDNVGIKSITKSLEPGSALTLGVHIVSYIAKDAADNVGSCSFEINVTREFCSDLKDPVNGSANCMDWVAGKLCQPFCNSGYIMNPDDSPYYTCDESGFWNPSDAVSPCLKYFPALTSECDPGFEYRKLNETGENICLECPFGTKWSSASRKCEEV